MGALRCLCMRVALPPKPLCLARNFFGLPRVVERKEPEKAAGSIAPREGKCVPARSTVGDSTLVVSKVLPVSLCFTCTTRVGLRGLRTLMLGVLARRTRNVRP